MRNGVIPLVELQFFAILHFQRGTTPRHAAGNDCRQNRRSAALKLGLFNLLSACWLLLLLLLLYVMTDDNVDGCSDVTLLQAPRHNSAALTWGILYTAQHST